MKVKKLSELRPGERGRIVAIQGSGPLRERILSMGFVIGSEVRVLRRAPLGDPMEYEIKGYKISLRKEEAESVLVKVK